MAYVIACRAVASLIEALVPPRLGHSRIGRAPEVQRFMQIFPFWQAELENPNFRSKYKDLIEIAIFSFRRVTRTSDLLSDLQKSSLEGWVDSGCSESRF